LKENSSIVLTMKFMQINCLTNDGNATDHTPKECVEVKVRTRTVAESLRGDHANTAEEFLDLKKYRIQQ
jgi:hypothetical protein